MVSAQALRVERGRQATGARLCKGTSSASYFRLKRTDEKGLFQQYLVSRLPIYPTSPTWGLQFRGGPLLSRS